MAKLQEPEDPLQTLSTDGSFFTTNPGDGLTALWSHSEVALDGSGGAPMLDSARMEELQREAELRAEHQAQARAVMLRLSGALSASHEQQQELSRLLHLERGLTSRLHGRMGRLEEELEEATAILEQQKADELLARGFASGNQVFLSMMLEKSREGYESNFFGEQPGEASGLEWGDEASREVDEEEPSAEETLALRAQSLAEHLSSAIVAKGDRVTFSLIFKLWLREVWLTKQRRLEEEMEQQRKLEEEERERKMQEEVDQRVRDVHHLIASLGQQLEVSQEELELSRQQISVLERALKSGEDDARERERELRASCTEFQRQLRSTQQTLLEREAEVRQLTEDLEEQKQKYLRAQAEHEVERQQLQETVRRIMAELHEVTALAKYMRETMLKSKRDAAASVAPVKLAELIMQLEAMRDELNSLRRDNDGLKGDNQDLQQKLEKNRRRLELERQFLPLIRQARGPLGPKGGGGSGGVLMALTPEPSSSPETNRKLLRSHSSLSHGSPLRSGS